jgi:molecular chaperone IbpA
MTNITLRSLDIPTLHKHAIGFDTIFDRLLNSTTNQTTNYPPYNIIKQTDDKYVLELATAGFREGEIDVTVEKSTLIVTGNKVTTQNEDAAEYLHRGISARSFQRTFTIGEYVEVVGASVQDGILTIELERIVPEEKKPKKIAIAYGTNLDISPKLGSKKEKVQS